ncbi:GNAT family N-acetyltransferase [Tenacibaculum mesophilum]|uniref:GNAT family N-acetyltransferase n=1 Tax=Tenacibaculum mesophilum TaxID=104268 RepID=A0AAE9SHK4_9FLAO|nr:GNAT family N-acetyltransferase [Tenacibaculum mesophilum]UTD15914.1 GNAT family N-acetyltransferase [Tenacibaculum mesophilum]
MTTITTREAKKEDLEVLLGFEQGIIEAERPFDSSLKEGKISYYNLEEMIFADNVHLIVAVSGDEIVGSGYLRIEKSESYRKNEFNGYIGFMYVKPNFRGKRISSLILESLKSWAKSKELKELRLDVYNENLAAIKSYERFGFNKSLINMKMEI